MDEINEIYAPVVAKLERIDAGVKALLKMLGDDLDLLDETGYVIAVHRYSHPTDLYGFHLLRPDGSHVRSYGTYSQEMTEKIAAGFKAATGSSFTALEDFDHDLAPARLGRCAPFEWKNGSAIAEQYLDRFAIIRIATEDED